MATFVRGSVILRQGNMRTATPRFHKNDKPCFYGTGHARDESSGWKMTDALCSGKSGYGLALECFHSPDVYGKGPIEAFYLVAFA
ncbi:MULTISPECIES: hypothetical protein [unclassified Sphingomonas]|uniref:hypothetical protein n=1 Tax=unclassified Sphingomonas TaxID=196159 RepID=UPI000A63941D|nr:MULTISPECIES: hypothetical protein [unclassified Sphingomonas]